MSSRSPPPLQHPKPTHPAYPPPEPPHTPGRSSASSPYSITGRLSQDDGGYQRYSSPPVDQQQQQQHQQHHGAASTSAYNPGVGGPAHARGFGAAGPNAAMGYGNNNNFGGWPGMNDATAQMGLQFAGGAVQAGQDYVEKNLHRYIPLPLVKTCFSVTNSYVLRKLRLVLFPWRHRPWGRQIRRTGDNGSVDQWAPPRDDINAPDLYIPTMALVTYTLLATLASGLQSRFDPEVLGLSLSKAIGVVVTEFVVIKLGCYLLDVRGGGASGVELLGYGGYKFVGIIATILVSFLNVGWAVTGATFFYTFCANAFFLLRSLKYVLLPDPNTSATAATLSPGQRSRRIQFLFVVAMAQALWMGLLSLV
ncbi:Protein transport protein yif1 [Vanrija albida]|uniref:Protein YIF1 n=1 Tax=Vanrija albida TaxID=181172 RepID=A0ABR3QD75_9TREE